MFELSKDENTIVIVLDTLDGAFMHQVLVDNPDFIDRLDGFTNYGNTLASGARTTVAMPLILTGIPASHRYLRRLHRPHLEKTNRF